MQRLSTTVVAVVGGSQEVVAGVKGAANVRTLPTSRDEPALQRAVAAWGQAARVTAPYSVHDADPLAAVAEAWVRRFDELAPAGELEVAVSETLTRWRAGSMDLPDYYLLVDPEGWTPTRRHWYLGYLAGLAPVRVVATHGDLLATIGHLATGRWWPDLDRLLTGIDRIVPDRAGLPELAAAQDRAGRGQLTAVKDRAGRPGGGLEDGSGQLIHLPGDG
jgi:hypothetical protein